MNAKKSDGIPFMSKLKNGRYKYQRRVPLHAQKIVGKKIWDLSLGSDYVVAVDKARSYAGIHDDLLTRLSTPENRELYKEDMEDEAAAIVVRMREYAQVTVNGKGEWQDVPPMEKNPGLWRNTADKMKSARTLPRKEELEALAAHAAFAFGDRATFNKVGGSEYHAALIEVLEPQKPTDPVDAVVFDALKTALDARIQEVGGTVLVNPDHTLNGLHARIAKLRNTKPTTIANHKVTTDKLNKFLTNEKGYDHEPSIASLTPELLQDYRDHLLDDDNIGNGSVRKYFDGLNSVFRFALKEGRIPGLVSNPVQQVEMPPPNNIEDSMYLPFTSAEMQRVWAEAQDVWGPHNTKSHFSEGRRKAFLMCLRVLLWSGLRPTEFFWLRDHGEVTPEHMFVERTKTGVKRYIPLCDHIKDFHQFTKDDGYEDCIFIGKHRGEIYGEYNAEKLKEAMRRSFGEIRKRAKVTDKRKVLYSTKDTLLQRLRSVAGYSTYLEVCVTGHVKRLEKGRHYGGILGEDEDMRAKVKAALDSVIYW